MFTREGKMILLIIALTVMSLPKSVCAQISHRGFFIDGRLATLLLNGYGKLSYDGFNADLNTDDDIFSLDVEEDESGYSVHTRFSGWGWENNWLWGVKPVIGYRFSSRIAISGSYSYYLKKNGEQSEKHWIDNMDYTNIEVDASSEYSQNVIQILGQFHPSVTKTGNIICLLAGFEVILMNAEWGYDYSLTSVLGDGPNHEYSYKAKGDDKTLGFILGAGYEVPLASQKISFIGSALYSFSRYDGHKLLESKIELENEYYAPETDLELDVGGLACSMGVRWYFKK